MVYVSRKQGPAEAVEQEADVKLFHISQLMFSLNSLSKSRTKALDPSRQHLVTRVGSSHCIFRFHALVFRGLHQILDELYHC